MVVWYIVRDFEMVDCTVKWFGRFVLRSICIFEWRGLVWVEGVCCIYVFNEGDRDVDYVYFLNECSGGVIVLVIV